jgi:hypothetical protein
MVSKSGGRPDEADIGGSQLGGLHRHATISFEQSAIRDSHPSAPAAAYQDSSPASPIATDDLTTSSIALLGQRRVQVSTVYQQVEQTVIITTDDKVRLCLNRHLEKMGRRQEWIAPFGLLLTIILTLVTVDFKSVVLSKDTWLAIFVIAAVLSALWLVSSLRHLSKASSIDEVIEDLVRPSGQAKVKDASSIGRNTHRGLGRLLK